MSFLSRIFAPGQPLFFELFMEPIRLSGFFRHTVYYYL
jgi:hypothetical protein